jgi:hypothetical protein
MKNAKALLLASLPAATLLPATLSPAQSLPNAPAPAPPPDPAWERLRGFAPGVPVVVFADNRPPVHCLFQGATETYLDCRPAGDPPGVGYRFDRASVASVDLDFPAENGAQFQRPPRNYHPVWIASMLAGGLLVGLAATHTTDDGNAAKAGAVGALVVGLIGAPLAFLPHPQEAYPPGGFALVPPLELHAHPLRLFHFR